MATDSNDAPPPGGLLGILPDSPFLQGPHATIRMSAASAKLLAKAIPMALAYADERGALSNEEHEELRSLAGMLGDLEHGDILNDFLL